MRTVNTHLVALLSVGIGGGSLLLFVYFLLFGYQASVPMLILSPRSVLRQRQSRSAA